MTLVGCATDEDGASEDGIEDGIDDVGLTSGKSDGSSLSDCEKQQIVDYLNGGVTKDALVAAGVHSRAAGNLVAHRDGADGIAGTADDDLFDSVEEVDAVPYVGPAAFAGLVDAIGDSCSLLQMKGTCSVTSTTFYNGYGTPRTETSPIALTVRLVEEDTSLPLPRDVKGTVLVESPWGTIPSGLWRAWCNKAQGWGSPPDAACSIGPFEISTSALWVGSGGYSYFKHEDEGYRLVVGAEIESGRDTYYDNHYSTVRYSCRLAQQ